MNVGDLCYYTVHIVRAKEDDMVTNDHEHREEV